MSDRPEHLRRIIDRLDNVRRCLQNMTKGVKTSSTPVPTQTVMHLAGEVDLSVRDLRTIDGGGTQRRVLERDRVSALNRAWDDVRGGYVCASCKTLHKDRSTVAVDHVIPLARGGSNALENLTVLCAACNAAKGAKAA